jgi:transcriptional regulator with XRE-family HTH domain
MPQQPRHLDPWVSSIAYFGAELRAQRTRNGMSQAELGRVVHISGDLIAKIEKGQRRPGTDLIHRLDRTLSARGSLARLIVTMHGGKNGEDDDAVGPEEKPDPALAVLHDQLSHEGGTEHLTALRQVIDGMRQLDHGLGSGLGLAALPAHAEIADALVRSTTGVLHRRALSTLGEIHQLTGWMRFDQGDARGAETSFAAALGCAERAEDDALMAYILGPSLGFAETYYGDPAGGARHCAEALVRARATGNARLTAFVLTIGARAQARLGDRKRCRQMLELARRELAQHSPEAPDPLWLEVFDHAALRGHSGSCLLDLGQPRRAIAPLVQQDQTAAKTFLRNRVIWLLDRARAHLQLDEVDEGCSAIGQALDAAAGTSSRRTLSRFQAIDGRLRAAGLAGRPQVTELHERLRLLVAA